MFPKALKTGRSLSKGSRAQNSVYSGLLALIVALSQGASVRRGLVCYLLILLLYALATNFNNISDLQTDILNHRKDNPLTSGSLNRFELAVFSCLCLLAIIALQFNLRQPQTAVLTSLYLLLSYAYSDAFFRVKSRGLLSTALLSVCYGSIPLLLGFYQGTRANPHQMVALSLLVSLSLIPLLLAKDYKDYEGDKATHKNTPLIMFGHKRLRLLASGLSFVAVGMYGFIGLEHHKNMLAITTIAGMYCLLIHTLHMRQGIVRRGYRLVLLIVLLAIPASLLSNLL